LLFTGGRTGKGSNLREEWVGERGFEQSNPCEELKMPANPVFYKIGTKRRAKISQMVHLYTTN